MKENGHIQLERSQLHIYDKLARQDNIQFHSELSQLQVSYMLVLSTIYQIYFSKQYETTTAFGTSKIPAV